jgi:Uma2 family endonuclease
MQAAIIHYHTIDEYLALEQDSDVRHEYLGGEIVAMPGGSKAHNLISINLVSALTEHLQGSPCTAYMADMKVYIDAAKHYFYPDVMVVCEDSKNLQKEYQVDNARLIIEVLSGSTDQRDREYKRITYRLLSDLQEYVLIDQSKQEVSCYRRCEDGWEYVVYRDEEEITLQSVGLTLSMQRIYQGL